MQSVLLIGSACKCFLFCVSPHFILQRFPLHSAPECRIHSKHTWIRKQTNKHKKNEKKSRLVPSQVIICVAWCLLCNLWKLPKQKPLLITPHFVNWGTMNVLWALQRAPSEEAKCSVLQVNRRGTGTCRRSLESRANPVHIPPACLLSGRQADSRALPVWACGSVCATGVTADRQIPCPEGAQRAVFDGGLWLWRNTGKSLLTQSSTLHRERHNTPFCVVTPF